VLHIQRFADKKRSGDCSRKFRIHKGGPRKSSAHYESTSDSWDAEGPNGEILHLSAAWDMQRDNTTAAFWKDAPWLTRNDAGWRV
jgi:hypothetical protein